MITRSNFYALAQNQVVVAVGSKKAMLSMRKKSGGTVYYGFYEIGHEFEAPATSTIDYSKLSDAELDAIIARG